MIQSHREPEPRRREPAYDLETSALPGPPLQGQVVVRRDEDELIDAVAADLVVHADNCVRQFGDFHIALSGGEMFARLYRRLMFDPACRWLPWRRAHLWFVEERCIGFEHEDSAFRFISELIADHADIPAEQIHPIFASSPTAETDYEQQIRETLAWREPGQDRLDYVLLGMGTDGRTAGLYVPDAPSGGPFVRRSAHPGSSHEDDPVIDRVTMTPTLINSSRLVAVLATGAARADAVQRLARSDTEASPMPIAAIAPINGELRWYLDGPAAGLPDKE